MQTNEVYKKMSYGSTLQATEHNFYVQKQKGEVVSSFCLIPWEWDYDGIILKVGELSIVGTVEKYQKQGLIRSQVEYFKQLLDEKNFDISVIQGVPYFYRNLDMNILCLWKEIAL